MVKVIFDTNILIDHFDGIQSASDELARYEDAAISTITWSEVMSLPGLIHSNWTTCALLCGDSSYTT